MLYMVIMVFALSYRFAIFLTVLLGFQAVPHIAVATVPRGVFSLAISGKAASNIVLANPDVTGISVRYAWANLEPTENVYAWTFLDSEVARAAAAGKQVLLRIETQSDKPAWVTTAIQLAGGGFFTFTNNGATATIPVFWDPTYLAKKKAMIAALGAHFTNNPAVTVVSASFANATSEDWSVPHTSVDIANWFGVGYTSAKMLDAGQQIIDATMAAFPNQFVTLAIGGDGHVGGTGNLDPTAEYVPATAIPIANASWPGRLIAQINSLATFNPVAPAAVDSSWNVLWTSQPNVAAQMVYWCFNDTTYRVNGGIPIDPATALTLSVINAVTYGTNYIEIYQTDVINLPAIITYAKTLLNPILTPIQTSLANVSTRAHVLSGDSVMVGGFIITGNIGKEVVLRGLGPSLANAGVNGVLTDPILELYDSTGALIAQNDNWTALPADVVASGLQPAYPAESLIAITLPPGSYTAVLRGAAGSTGVALFELYDLAPTNSNIANVSTRGQVGIADEAMIGGFIVGGSGPITVLVRAIGPSLSGLGVSGALLDPALELRNGDGSLIFANDNWRTNQEQQIIDSTLAPSDDREAAIIVTLPQGSYTATVRGVANSTGVALVEVYNLGNK